MRSRKQVKRTINIPLALAAAALCLAIFSAPFVSGTYARYAAKAGAEDAARVAKFQVDLNYAVPAETGAAAQTPGALTPDQTEVQISIDNSSETAIRYTVTLEFQADASARMTEPKLTVGNATIAGVYSGGGKILTFTQTGGYTGELAPGSSASATLSFKIPYSLTDSTLDFDNDVIQTETETNPFVIRVTYVQID